VLDVLPGAIGAMENGIMRVDGIDRQKPGPVLPVHGFVHQPTSTARKGFDEIVVERAPLGMADADRVCIAPQRSRAAVKTLLCRACASSVPTFRASCPRHSSALFR
jgi:hypothetical protein